MKKWKTIKIQVTTYSGVRTAISKILEEGRIIKFIGKDTKKKLDQLNKNIIGIEKRKERWTEQQHQDYQSRVMQSFYSIMGINTGKPETGIALYKGSFIMNIPPKTTSAKAPSTPPINTLQELLQNWEKVNEEMWEHDVKTHGLMNKYEEYEEWKQRFKEAAGLGLTNDDIFRTLDALDVNRHHLFTLQGYLVKEAKEGRTYNLDLDNLDVNIFSTIQEILTTKGSKLDEDDLEAIDVLTRIRDQIV